MQTASKSNARQLGLAAAVAILVLGAASLAIFLQAPVIESQQITVDAVWSDRVDAPSGMQYSLVDVNATNMGMSPWHLDPTLFVLSGGTPATYPPTRTYNETVLLIETDIASGHYVHGIVAFELPTSDTPSSMSYSDSGRGITLKVAHLPPVSAFASRFNYNVHLKVNGEPVAVGGWTVTTTNGTYPWVYSIIANGLVLNTSNVFFSGQAVQVNLWFEYLKKPNDPTMIRLVSASNDNGFTVLSRSMLPQTLNGWASQAGIDFLLKVPPGEHSGSLSFSVQFSP